MMRKILEAILLGIVSLILGCLATFLDTPDIYVQISDEVISINGENYYNIYIQNSTNEVIKDLYINLPTVVSTNELISNEAILIENVVKNSENNKSLFRVSNILGNEEFEILIKTRANFDPMQINVSADKIKFDISRVGDISRFINSDFWNLVKISIIISLSYAAASWYVIRKTVKITEDKVQSIKLINEEHKIKINELIDNNHREVNELINSNNKINSDLDKKYMEILERSKEELVRQEKLYEIWKSEKVAISLEIETIKSEKLEIAEKLKETKVDIKKQDFMLRSRIREYHKELEFWRDTVRKVMYSATNKRVEPDELFDIVTKSLKTYQTRCKPIDKFDLDAIKAMSEIIESEQFK